MRSNWSALHHRFLSQCNRATSERLFSQIRARHPVLSPSATIDELILRQQRPGGDPEDRNAVLRSLVQEAQADGAGSELASIILILALWPGLDAVHGRLARDFPRDRDEIGTEIIGRMALDIRRLDLNQVNRIAATLVMNTERDIRRDLIRNHNRCKCETPWQDEGGKPIEALSDANETSISPAEWHQRLLARLGRDADLFIRIVVHGETQAQAGQALGLTHDAARKRHQRAMKKMDALKINSAACPIRPPGLAFDKHEAVDLSVDGGQR